MYIIIKGMRSTIFSYLFEKFLLWHNKKKCKDRNITLNMHVVFGHCHFKSFVLAQKKIFLYLLHNGMPHIYTCASDTLYIQSGEHLSLFAWSAGDVYLSVLVVPVDVSADQPLHIQPTCAMSSVLYTWRRLLSKEDLQLQEGLNRKQRSIAKNNGIGQAASCCVLMEEDFVTKLLRNSGNSAPDQQNRGASGNTSATGPYQNLRVPEVSGLWDSTIDLSRSHDATTTKTAQVCSLNCYL